MYVNYEQYIHNMWTMNFQMIKNFNNFMLNFQMFNNIKWTVNFQMFKLILEKIEQPEIKLPTSIGSLKKQESSRKISTSVYWLCQSLWLCGSQQTVGNSSGDRNTRPP